MKCTNQLLIIVACFFAIASCKTDKKQRVNSAKKTTVKNEKVGQAFIEDDESSLNVLQIAISSKDHTTLVAAVQAAGLENALVNAGPLMVFAPTNEAFASLPDGTVESLLKPENKGALANILKYHVTPGNYSKSFLKKFKKLGQANNGYVKIDIVDGEAVVGGANIIASIKAGNGIVHVIDKVLIPTEK